MEAGMKSIKLKPCPFCGSEDIKLFGTTVNCCNCYAQSYSSLHGVAKERMKDAIEKWNRRAYEDVDEKNELP
jgi:Lar family restriction alleviation protein